MTDTQHEGSLTERSRVFRSKIELFLKERLQSNMKKKPDEDVESQTKLIAKHQPEVWLADAARRIKQLQQVTHAIKFTHPSAEGTSLYSTGNIMAGPLEVGSHILGTRLEADIAGNAAALDVYKFLRLSVEGRTFLQWAAARDADFSNALSADPEMASEWMTAFSSLPEAKRGLASHTLAKQIYWPLGDGTYHLLAPLLSSSLVHAVWNQIKEDRFSENAKGARAARKAREAYPHGYRDYPKAVIQCFGGSKPQNISQLNSERKGKSYLLASIPPAWRFSDTQPPMRIETVFSFLFMRRNEVRRLVETLKAFLHRVAEIESNVRIRKTREALVADLCGETLNFAAELRMSLEPGWTMRDECSLNIAEQCWLDPGRCQIDGEFFSRYTRGDWKDEVCLRFANWLNATLQTEKTFFGASEALAWRSALRHELNLFREDLENE